MPTENRRVAAYLPPHLVGKFEQFKLENSLGDSQALIFILSQFLEVAHSVGRSSSDLDKRINQLKIELKTELLSELLLQNKDNSKPVINILSESKGLKLPPVDQKSESNSNIPSESLKLSSELQPLTGYALDKRLNILQGNAGKIKNKHKNPEKFAAWSKTKDPDGIAWEFREGLYYPLI
jgi:hypothetical protein